MGLACGEIGVFACVHAKITPGVDLKFFTCRFWFYIILFINKCVNSDVGVGRREISCGCLENHTHPHAKCSYQLRFPLLCEEGVPFFLRR